MKFKKILVVLFVIPIIVASCRKEKTDLEGLWIGAKDYYDGVLQFDGLEKPLVFVEQDSIQFLAIGNVNDAKAHVFGFKTIRQNILRLKNGDEIRCRILGKDSIVVTHSGFPKREMTFYRFLKKGSFSKDLFKNNHFELFGNKDQELVLSFPNDTLCQQQLKNDSNFKNYKWTVINFKKHSFLVLNDEMGSIIFHIDSVSEKGNKIVLNEHLGNKHLILKKMVTKIP